MSPRAPVRVCASLRTDAPDYLPPGGRRVISIQVDVESE